MSQKFVTFATAGSPHIVSALSNRFLQITLAEPENGTQTAGTLTFRGKVKGGAEFEDINEENTISIAAPSTLTICGNVISELEVSVSGFSGTATEIKLSLCEFN